ncbi:PilZ domain-containing protein [Paenibacillus sp. SC116]|uniref:PilZ domain-containing protein n=1 Tax=Paenibacillus sp. SC116 TaxID=2968986 RepID=UPI00215AE8F9|nr:PilZ domain-containing protein [Paenibacillus sp. SC116]MCR8844179.1 PilZ domain-containing protein [Paenibacillus sp. SC116]
MSISGFPHHLSLRLTLKRPVLASMGVELVNQKPVNSSLTCPVIVTSVSPYGLYMFSHLDLPLQHERDYVLRFNFRLHEQEIILFGRVVWCDPDQHLFRYGIRLQIMSEERSRLLRLLNDELVRMMPTQKGIHEMYQRVSDQVLRTTSEGIWKI